MNLDSPEQIEIVCFDSNLGSIWKLSNMKEWSGKKVEKNYGNFLKYDLDHVVDSYHNHNHNRDSDDLINRTLKSFGHK